MEAARFVQDVSAAGNVVIPGAGMIHPSMGALLAGFGMAPAGVLLPERPPVSSSYGAGAVWNGVAMSGQHQEGGGERAPPPPPQKGPWTGEEDEILKEMVREHGDGKWAVVARSLPGRIGKQCRERWINHLRPDIKKSQWTEEDDRALMEAHKIYGNRWTTIARFLPGGRSESAVKNRWNATRRSLNAKRQLKKKTVETRLSVLEEYIRSLSATASPSVLPPLYNFGYGEVVVSPPSVVQPTAAAAGMGMMDFSASSGGGQEAAGSGGGSDDRSSGADDMDVVQMAYREFLTLSPDQMTLHLGRFM